jgi:para-nitrobenzyl esterase
VPFTIQIFGQSAGGISIATLLTSPISIAKGHYQRAIAQSDPMALLFRTPQEQQKFGGLFSTLLGCPIAGSTQCLLSRSTAQILNVTLLEIELPFDNFGWKSVVSRMPWFPTIDGVVITASPLDAFASTQSLLWRSWLNLTLLLKTFQRAKWQTFLFCWEPLPTKP